MSLVRCNHCGHVYDTGRVKVVARHADCSVWRCPHCNALVDDNIWDPGRHFTAISSAHLRSLTDGTQVLMHPRISGAYEVLPRRFMLDENGEVG